MTDTAELRRVSPFADLPEDQLEWFLSVAEDRHFKAGHMLQNPGDPAEFMIVLLEGQIQARGEVGGEIMVITVDAGSVTGRLPYSRMKIATFSVRAHTDCHLLLFRASHFQELVQKMPVLTERLVGMMSDRIREVTRREQQRDRLAALGKLSAGLAHELNNPASAAKRAASQLRTTLMRIRDASQEIGRRNLSPEQKAELEEFEATLSVSHDAPPDTLTMSILEDELDSLLRSHGQNDLWELSAGLASKNVQPKVLEALFSAFEPITARAALVRIGALVEVLSLLDEIESSSSRISDLVCAIKEYTHMDQAPVQNVDVVKSLESTLTILNHKLKRGVAVQREYERAPLLVNSFGSELNQVWTNIIDNAIDAMEGKGQLRVRTYRDDGCAVVEIGDSGPGISSDVLPRIFEPFFTTKGVGEGTGLGLDTVQRIVKKHNGTIQVDSKPGDTRFQVWLPLSESDLPSASHQSPIPSH